MSQRPAQTVDPHVLDHAFKGRRWWLWVGTLVIVLFSYQLTAVFGRTRQQSIEAVAARRGDLTLYLNELGIVMPASTVTIHTRVDGELVNVHFKEGQTVKTGDLLTEIDQRPFKVQLAQAEGRMARDRALLVHAQTQLARYKELFAQNIIARQDLDTQQSLAGQYAGLVENDQAAIDGASLDLAYCRISSPINGRVGLRLIDPGNIVHAIDTQGLTVITQVQPVAVIISVPQDDLPRVMKATKGSQLLVDAYDRGFKNHLARGTLLTLDNEVDLSTGTVKLKASFPNQDNALFPNQSVNIRVTVDTMRSTVLIPESSVHQSSQGMFVYIVKSDQTLTMRSVVVGADQGDTAAISRGLNPGELVALDGTDKLQHSTRVSVQVARSSP